MKRKATVIIPTFNHARTLEYSIRSVMNQTIKDIEIFVIGDGAPDITKRIMSKFIKEDKRITFIDKPKGPRHGEIYRHEVLSKVNSEIVCYLSDDDLYFPDHIEVIYEELKNYDFVHTLPYYISVHDEIKNFPGDLSIKKYFDWVMNSGNFIPLSNGAHKLSYYKSLPFGWRTTPQGTPTDVYMWRQILGKKSCRFKSINKPTVIHFPSPERQNFTQSQRLRELKKWGEKINTIKKANSLREEIINKSIANYAGINLDLLEEKTKLERMVGMRDEHIKALIEHIDMIENSLMWKIKNKFFKLKIFKLLRSFSNRVLGRKDP